MPVIMFKQTHISGMNTSAVLNHPFHCHRAALILVKCNRLCECLLHSERREDQLFGLN